MAVPVLSVSMPVTRSPTEVPTSVLRQAVSATAMAGDRAASREAARRDGKWPVAPDLGAPEHRLVTVDGLHLKRRDLLRRPGEV